MTEKPEQWEWERLLNLDGRLAPWASVDVWARALNGEFGPLQLVGIDVDMDQGRAVLTVDVVWGSST